MKKKNKSNFCLAAIKRRLTGKTKRNTSVYKRKLNKIYVYDICVVKKNLKHTTGFVIEKLGSIDFINKKINLNFFRLIYWMSFNISITSNAWKFLSKQVFFKKW